MTARELFGIVVRTVGLLMGLYGLSIATAIVWRMLVLMPMGDGYYRTVNLFLDLSVGFGWLLGGLLLLLCADRIVWFAYRGRPAGVCGNCGYDLRGTPQRCPECGTDAATPA